MSAPPPEKGDSASGAAVDQSSPARKDFESHDWESDAQWQRYLQGVELPALPALEAAALRRLKRKYWLRSVVSSCTPLPHTQCAHLLLAAAAALRLRLTCLRRSTHRCPAGPIGHLPIGQQRPACCPTRRAGQHGPRRRLLLLGIIGDES
jgi:hypothetical protein